MLMNGKTREIIAGVLLMLLICSFVEIFFLFVFSSNFFAFFPTRNIGLEMLRDRSEDFYWMKKGRQFTTSHYFYIQRF